VSSSPSLSSATGSVRIKLGSTIIASSIDSSLLALSNNYFSAEISVTCRSVGTSGTVYTQGRTLIASTTGITTASMRQLVSVAPVVINTTIAAPLSATYQWGAASTSNSVTSTNTFVEVLK